MKCEKVGRDQAKEVRELARSCAEKLTKEFGEGHWSKVYTLGTWQRRCEEKDVYLCRDRGKIVATFTLSERKPTYVSKRKFTKPNEKFLWLSNLFVHASKQRRGYGRKCLKKCREIAARENAKWVWFDAYAAKAGASVFYEKCGCKRVDETSEWIGLFIFEMKV